MAMHMWGRGWDLVTKGKWWCSGFRISMSSQHHAFWRVFFCCQDSDSDFIKKKPKIHDFFGSLQFVGIRTAVVAGSIPKGFFSRWIPQPRVPQMVEDFLLPFHLSTRSSGRFVDKWTMNMIWLIWYAFRRSALKIHIFLSRDVPGVAYRSGLAQTSECGFLQTSIPTMCETN